METSASLIYVVLPVIGVIVGVTLQYLFSRDSEQRKHQQNLRTQAYVDFLRGVVGKTFAQKYNEKEFLALLTDAKARITVYGGRKSL